MKRPGAQGKREGGGLVGQALPRRDHAPTFDLTALLSTMAAASSIN